MYFFSVCLLIIFFHFQFINDNPDLFEDEGDTTIPEVPTPEPDQDDADDDNFDAWDLFDLDTVSTKPTFNYT